jgi:hypothetical protein
MRPLFFQALLNRSVLISVYRTRSCCIEIEITQSGLRPAGTATSSSSGAGAPSSSALDSPHDDSTTWLRSQRKHYFIVSNGGRPIYTLHGQPNDAAAVSALLFSFASLAHDSLGADASATCMHLSSRLLQARLASDTLPCANPLHNRIFPGGRLQGTRSLALINIKATSCP